MLEAGWNDKSLKGFFSIKTLLKDFQFFLLKTLTGYLHSFSTIIIQFYTFFINCFQMYFRTPFSTFLYLAEKNWKVHFDE